MQALVCHGCPSGIVENVSTAVGCIACNHSAANQSLAWYANDTSVTVQWEAIPAADPILEYRIYTRQSPSSEGFSLNGVQVAAKPTQYTVGGLQPAAKYEIIVRGRSIAGESAPPNGVLVAYTGPGINASTQAAPSNSTAIFMEWELPVSHSERPLRTLHVLYQRIANPLLNRSASSWTLVLLTLQTTTINISNTMTTNQEPC